MLQPSRGCVSLHNDRLMIKPRFGIWLIFHKGFEKAVFILNKLRPPANSDEFRIRGCYFLPKVVDSDVANSFIKEEACSRTSMLSIHTCN